MKTLIAMYDNLDQARATVEDLVSAGFMRDKISLVASDHDNTYSAELETVDVVDETAEGAALGAMSGGAVGGLAGLLFGLGAFAIPGIGPVVAAGPIAAALAGAGIGAATGGILGALAGWGIPEEEAAYYAEGVRRGGHLVSVEVDESRVNDVTSILNQNNPVDISNRSEMWRQAGWNGYDLDSEVHTNGSNGSATYHNGKTSHGYDSYVPNFRHHFDTSYAGRNFTYDQFAPAYQYGYRLANDTRYSAYNSWDEIKESARREWEEAEDTAENAWDDFKDSVRYAWEQVKEAFDVNDYDRYAPSFETHYRDTYGDTNNGYSEYEPGYRYGHYLATTERYGRYNTWNELEAEARQEWEEAEDTAQHAWNDFKDAVRYAWEEVKEAVS